MSVSNASTSQKSRPKRNVRQNSAKLDFRDEFNFFKHAPGSPNCIPRKILKAKSNLKNKGSDVASSSHSYPPPPVVVYEPLMLGSKKSALTPNPVVHLKPVVKPTKRRKTETPIDISKILSSSYPRRSTTSPQEIEMDRIIDLDIEHQFSDDSSPNSVASTPHSRKRKTFVFDESDTQSEDPSDNAVFPESPSLAAPFSFSPIISDSESIALTIDSSSSDSSSSNNDVEKSDSDDESCALGMCFKSNL